MLLKLAFAGIAGYALYKYATREHGGEHKAAFATGEATPRAMQQHPHGSTTSGQRWIRHGLAHFMRAVARGAHAQPGSR